MLLIMKHFPRSVTVTFVKQPTPQLSTTVEPGIHKLQFPKLYIFAKYARNLACEMSIVARIILPITKSTTFIAKYYQCKVSYLMNDYNTDFRICYHHITAEKY